MSPRHDQSPIFTCLDGSLTVATYIRRQWLRDFPKTLDRCDISVELGKTPKKSFGLRRHFVAPIPSPFTATLCVPEHRVSGVRRSSLPQRDSR
jgi:hypothetical protein